MPDYAKLRDLISHRVTFEFDTGAKVVGYVAACKPGAGTVQVVVMSRVDILDWSVAECEGDNRLRFFGKFSVKCLHNTLTMPMVSPLSLQPGEGQFSLPVFPALKAALPIRERHRNTFRPLFTNDLL